MHKNETETNYNEIMQKSDKSVKILVKIGIKFVWCTKIGKNRDKNRQNRADSPKMNVGAKKKSWNPSERRSYALECVSFFVKLIFD